MNFWKFGILIVIIQSIHTKQLRELTVKTSSGYVEGFYINGQFNEFIAFEGIPFAEPPVGNLRFKESIPIRKWNSTFIANKTIACVHFDMESKEIVGQEDCLVINVYAPKWADDEPLNVIVHIHGDLFLYNAGYYFRPDFLLDHNVIYVSFNYRLGALGFLSTENEVVSGNNGLKDQVLALQWIQTNIENFGGNPKSVTLTGWSSGGASVTFHYISPMSKLLFNRGIALSGTCLSPEYLTYYPLKKAKQLASRLNCTTESVIDMVTCLRNQPARKIVEEQALGVDLNFRAVFFGPVIENATNPNTFLTKSPLEIMLLEHDTIQNLPLILENVCDEGLNPAVIYSTQPKYFDLIDKNWTNLAPLLLYYNDTIEVERWNILADDIRDKYLGGQPISNETFPNFVKILTDRIYLVPMQQTAILFAQKLNMSVYYNIVTYRGEFSYANWIAKNYINYGVCHGDDLEHILPRFLGYHIFSNNFQLMSKILVDMWLQFANDSTVQIGYLKPSPFKQDYNGVFNFVEIRSPFFPTIEASESLARFYDFWFF